VYESFMGRTRRCAADAAQPTSERYVDPSRGYLPLISPAISAQAESVKSEARTVESAHSVVPLSHSTGER